MEKFHAFHVSFILTSCLTIVIIASSAKDPIIDENYGIGELNRSSFPAGFLFGTASSSYQYEGAANEDGKGPSIWDFYTKHYPGRIVDHSNGDVAVDSYHRYKEDVKIMKEMGLDAYRFSISWPRLIPQGKISKGVNQKGLMYYHNLIDELLANGVRPFITLFHWDIPQALEEEYGGFLSPQVVDDFRDYADLCFGEFGDKVKDWITFNEPFSYSSGGYAAGFLAPGRCSAWMEGRNCTGGDSGTEPYLVTHHQLLAHAATVDIYRKKYQASQKGMIGITLLLEGQVAYSEAEDDKNAASRALDFAFGWFMDPVTFGDYPHTMRSLVGDRLPKFTTQQSELLKGSYDFVGLNYYSASYVRYDPQLEHAKPNYLTDAVLNHTIMRNGELIGPRAVNSSFICSYPRGIYDILLYTKTNYNNPLIYITENGIDEANDDKLPLQEALTDKMRIIYHHDHFDFLQLAIKDGVNVKGYFAWSLLDNFEWMKGYTVRLGFNYVDYKNGLKRSPKLSAKWFNNFLTTSSTDRYSTI